MQKPYYCKIEAYKERPAICIGEFEDEGLMNRKVWAVLDPEGIDPEIEGVYVSYYDPEFISGYFNNNFDRSPMFKVKCNLEYEYYQARKQKKGKSVCCKTCRELSYDKDGGVYYCGITDNDILLSNPVCDLYSFDRYWKEKIKT